MSDDIDHTLRRLSPEQRVAYWKNSAAARAAEIERLDVWVKTFIDHLIEAEADRDRARAAAVALEQEVAAVRALHSEWKIFTDCGHEHEETEKGVTNVIEVGVVCEKGYRYSVCHHCCVDDEGFLTEECATAHDHKDGLCDTNAVLDGGEG